MKIKTKTLRNYHYFAMCRDCDFEFENTLDRANVRAEAKKHVRKTGHRVTIEKATAIIYSPDV